MFWRKDHVWILAHFVLSEGSISFHKEAARIMPNARRLIALVLACLFASALASCSEPETGKRYHDEKFRYSIVFPEGWERFDGPTNYCLASAGAKNPEGIQIYVCVSEPPKMFLSTRSDYVNCEQAKDYVTEVLKGTDPDCRSARIIYRKVYATYYTRRVQTSEGVKAQFVSQSYLLWGGLLYTVTCYTMADTAEDARALYQKYNPQLLQSESTFFIHRPEGEE